MRIAILTFGSRGDVQPMVALGRGLKDAGVDVVVAVDSAFEGLVRGQGLEFARVEGDIQQALISGDGTRAMTSGANPIAMARLVRRNIEPILRRMIVDTMSATEGADGLLLGGAGYYAGTIIADARRIPFAQAYLQPMQVTREFPSPMLPLPARKNRAHYNRLSFVVGGQAFWQMLRPIVNRVRTQEFGLQPWPVYGNFHALQRERVLQICGYSRHVLPRPTDWPDTIHLTGYWFLPAQEWEPPPALVRFLDDGPAPICVGFGSMRHPDAAAFTRTLVEGIERTGCRAVILAGWGGIDAASIPSTMILLESAEHEWLFARCAVVVHHGGAGTTAAALRAGKPSVVIPFFGDQPFWGWRVEEIGAGPELIPQSKLTASRFAMALETALNDSRISACATRLGSLIRAEDGVGEAVRLLVPYFDTRGRGN